MRISARIDITATALEPIHHGAGSSGNTQLLRCEEIITPEGESEMVPFISGNSIKHLIREAGARFALDAMDAKDGTLTKAVTDLLFSGGALTKVGSSVNLARGRQLERLFPLLSLCGYSAGNCMTQSKLRVDRIHMVCVENAWRLPERIEGHALASKCAGALRGEEFGTRHESSRRPHVAKMLTDAETARMEKQVEEKGKGDTAQMIYDFETILPGAVLWGALYLDDVTEMELAALKSALSTACEGRGTDGGLLFRIGAKTSIGYGLVSMEFSGSLREPVQAPGYSESTELVAFSDSPSDVAQYAAHLREHCKEITAALTEVMS